MVIRGGENIYPREIEEFLFTHPAVAQAAVFGVPDPKYGEEVCVWVQPRPGQTATADDIRAFCKENVAHYKVPRYVKFVSEFPTTVSGKIQKFNSQFAALYRMSPRLGAGVWPRTEMLYEPRQWRGRHLRVSPTYDATCSCTLAGFASMVVAPFDAPVQAPSI